MAHLDGDAVPCILTFTLDPLHEASVEAGREQCSTRVMYRRKRAVGDRHGKRGKRNIATPRPRRGHACRPIPPVPAPTRTFGSPDTRRRDAGNGRLSDTPRPLIDP